MYNKAVNFIVLLLFYTSCCLAGDTYLIEKYKEKINAEASYDIINPDYMTIKIRIIKIIPLTIEVCMKNISNTMYYISKENFLKTSNDFKIKLFKDGKQLELKKYRQTDAFVFKSKKYEIINPQENKIFTYNIFNNYCLEKSFNNLNIWSKTKSIFFELLGIEKKLYDDLEFGIYELKVCYASSIYAAKWNNQWHKIYSGPVCSNTIKFEYRKK